MTEEGENGKKKKWRILALGRYRKGSREKINLNDRETSSEGKSPPPPTPSTGVRKHMNWKERSFYRGEGGTAWPPGLPGDKGTFSSHLNWQSQPMRFTPAHQHP
jgi:hypothetical protein